MMSSSLLGVSLNTCAYMNSDTDESTIRISAPGFANDCQLVLL